MYIIPIIENAASSSLTQYWLFLERNGTHCIEVSSEEEARRFVVENEIQAGTVDDVKLLSSPQHPGLLFVPVPSTYTELINFYTWSEVTPGTAPLKEVWRCFYWTTGSFHHEVLGVNEWLRETSLGGDHTVYSVIQAFRSSSANPS